MTRAAIVAMAQTRFEPKKGSERVQEMVWEVVKEVRDKTGLGIRSKPGDIDTAVTCSDDFFDARTISDACIGDLVGGHFGTEEKVAMDGLNAVFYAAACVLSGHSEATLVAGHCKESQGDSRNLIGYCASDPIFQRGIGLDYLSCAGLQMSAYLHRTGATERQCAAAVARDRRHAAKNPKAQAQKPVSVDDVMRSPYVCDPLKELDVYPVSDGAIAMIVTTEDRAKKLTDKPVFIEGAGSCYNDYYLGDRDLSRDLALVAAARRCYQRAGIKDPRHDLDLIEIAAGYSYQELLFLEALGLVDDGHAGKLIESGATDFGGKLPVNVSGGMLAGNPLMIGGLARAAECFLQLRGEAGDRQVAGAKKALAQGATGPAAQHHIVMVLAGK